MSKAFIKESADLASSLQRIEKIDPLPPGVTNYITPAGAESMHSLLRDLVEGHLPDLRRKLAGAEGNERNRLNIEKQILEDRIAYLEKRVSTMEVLLPDAVDQSRIFFGARVTVRNGNKNHVYEIVGVDESNPEEGKISWISPLAVCLRGAAVGEIRRCSLPGGELELEILDIQY